MAKTQKNISKNIRKNIAKQKEKKQGTDVETTIIKALKILLGIIIFVILLVLITRIANGDFKKDKEKEFKNAIIAGQIFNKKVDSYYVVLYNFYEDTMTESIDNIKKEKIYKVNLQDRMNASIIGEDNNLTNDIKTLKVKEPVMIKIENKEIVETKIGTSEINEYLAELSE